MAQYPQRNVVCSAGDSITVGSFSTAATQNAGYRLVLSDAAAVRGTPIKWIGKYANGDNALNNLHCGVASQPIDSIRSDSANVRTLCQPEGILFLCGINDLVPGTADACGTALTTALNDFYDRASHVIPGGGSTLSWVCVPTVLKYGADLVTVNPKVIDYNIRVLPAVIAAQRALGRDVFSWDAYSAVTSFSGDAVHPNDAGYVQLATGWLSAIASRLRST